MSKNVFISLIIFQVFFSSIVKAQEFPPVQNLYYTTLDNFIFYWTWDPPVREVAYYKITKNNAWVANIIHTFYIDTTFFTYYYDFSVTAVYEDPPGESEPVLVSLVVPGMLDLPFVEDFEDPGYFLGNYSVNGINLWEISEEEFYNGNQSICCKSEQSGPVAALYSPPIIPYSDNIKICFAYQTPVVANKSDTINVFLNQTLCQKLTGADVWTLYDTTLYQLESFYLSCISNFGGGVFVDDIQLEFISGNPIQLNNSLIQAYPNPFTSYLCIPVPETYQHLNTTLEIIDGSGKIIFSQKIPQNEQNITWNTLNKNTLPVEKGVYFYRFVNQDHHSASMQIIKY